MPKVFPERPVVATMTVEELDSIKKEINDLREVYEGNNADPFDPKHITLSDMVDMAGDIINTFAKKFGFDSEDLF